MNADFYRLRYSDFAQIDERETRSLIVYDPFVDLGFSWRREATSGTDWYFDSEGLLRRLDLELDVLDPGLRRCLLDALLIDLKYPFDFEALELLFGRHVRSDRVPGAPDSRLFLHDEASANFAVFGYAYSGEPCHFIEIFAEHRHPDWGEVLGS